MKRMCVAAWMLLLTAMLGAQPVPSVMSYQGYVTDASGAPVADGTYSFTFSLYESAAGGSQVWSETHSSVQVQSGLFAVVLGSANPLSFDFTRQYYLGIAPAGGSEYAPRVRLTTSAYSFAARVAERVADPAVLLESEVTAGAGISVTKTGGTLQIAATGSSLLQGDVVGPPDANRIADGAVTAAKIQDACITAAKIVPNIVSSVAGVKNDGGDIALLAGSNITITPDAAAHAITIAATGGSSFALPYKGNAASTSILFDVENAGTGSAGRFSIDNTATTKAALTAQNTGTSSTADAISAFADNGNALQASSSGDVSATITATNSGSGPVASFSKSSSSTGDIVQVSSVGGAGRGVSVTYSGTEAGVYVDNNAAGDGVEVRQDGTGKGAYLHIENTSTTMPALHALSKSTSSGGHAVVATAQGGSAIHAESDGTAATISAVSTASSLTGLVLTLGNPATVYSVNRSGDVWANGTSEARHFEANNSLGGSATPVEGAIYKDNVCGAWARINGAGTQLAAFGCTASRVSTGHYRFEYKNTFLSTYDAVPVANAMNSASPIVCVISLNSDNACEVKTYNLSGVLTDCSVNLVVFGRP